MTGNHPDSGNSLGGSSLGGSSLGGNPLGDWPKNPLQQHEDVFTTALRYVLDELTVEEKAEFECRLLGRQEVREAVAEAVALCQSAKHALDVTSQNAAPAANALPGGNAQPVQAASRVERVWRGTAAGAAMVVAASILLAVIITGNPFGLKPDSGVAANGASATGRPAEAVSLASGQTDRGKQLLLAWLSFFPPANDAALAADTSESAAEDDADALAADEERSEVDLAGGDLAGGATLADDDVIARVDSAMAASDWVFEAVAAEPSAAAVANPREG